MGPTRRHILLGGAAIASASFLPGLAFASDRTTLRVAIKKPAGDLDLTRYLALWGVQDMIFDPLVKYGDGGKIEPALAESWTVSDDSKSYAFKLRQNVTFSDGSPWNSTVAKWNFERWIGKPDHSWLAISNFYDHLEVADDSTISLHFKEPVPSALQQLTIIRPVRFMSPTSIAPDGTFKEPIGTGPWKLEKNDEVSTISRSQREVPGERSLPSRKSNWW